MVGLEKKELTPENKNSEEANNILNFPYVVVYMARVPAIYGPFNTLKDAETWAATMIHTSVYYTVPLTPPMLTY